MSRPAIPEQVKQEVDAIVKNFNERTIKKPDRYYLTRYRGSYLYLDRLGYGMASQICRLKYTGDTNDWEFAIFKHSVERYDAEEWMFPGSEHVDGTVEGALKAGIAAYPF